MAAILIAYTSAVTLSNQAFAQCPLGTVGCTGGQGGVGQILAGNEVHGVMTGFDASNPTNRIYENSSLDALSSKH
jgi:hypothetical protein